MMSVDYHVYFGPVIVCKNTIQNKEVLVNECPECKKQISSKYCSDCGSEVIETIRNSEVKKVDHWNVTELCDCNILFIYDDDNADFYISNVTKKQPSIILFNPIYDDVNEAISNQSLDIAEEITKFALEFSKEIAILQEAYGRENVTISWRLINWEN